MCSSDTGVSSKLSVNSIKQPRVRTVPVFFTYSGPMDLSIEVGLPTANKEKQVATPVWGTVACLSTTPCFERIQRIGVLTEDQTCQQLLQAQGPSMGAGAEPSSGLQDDPGVCSPQGRQPSEVMMATHFIGESTEAQRVRAPHPRSSSSELRTSGSGDFSFNHFVMLPLF